MTISNKQFWEHWKKGNYEEALNCTVVEEKKEHNRLQSMLFGTKDQLAQTSALTGISVGEFIYDYMMINPTVVQGLDFARTEDLSSLFTLSQFSSAIDTTTLTGDMAQLQGYVAEQFLAIELHAKGHDVEFPEASNNPGWDILVDGQPFQVKNLAGPEGVREHLEKYPDIPVYVNEELASHFEGNSMVYVSSISREEVLETTATTISHADDLLDFEIPFVAAGVSSIQNIKRVWKDDVTLNQAVFNVISDTSSRVVLGALGQKAGIIAGTLLFGPTGGITGAMFGAFAGASQGGKLSTGIKRTFSRKQENEVREAMIRLIEKVTLQIDNKISVKNKKIKNIDNGLEFSLANHVIRKDISERHQQEVKYLSNKKDELLRICNSIRHGSLFIIDVLPNVMATITKSGVHPVHIQEEIVLLQEKLKEYMKRG